MCSLYGVTRAGYYAWRSRGESAHQVEDRRLLKEIGAIFAASGGTYGSPRIQRSLAEQGFAVSRRRVERLMRLAGLRARVVRIYRSNPRLHRFFEQHPNRLWKRRAKRPNQIWVGDITYLPVAGRWRYLAVVMDQYSRRVLGWSLGLARGAKLPRAAFEHALRHRRPTPGLIFHSDRGSEYSALGLRQRLEQLGIRQSMTRGGSPADNAHMESFFHSLKADIVHGIAFFHDHQLRSCLRRYVRYYNHRRLHSALGYRSPVEYERNVA
jgi:putative transposase